MKYRYPGVKPFTKSEKNLFFGRNKNIDELYRLINVEKLTVMYGKSGYGKSSLINAGVVPKLEEDGKFQIVNIRFGSYTKDKSEMPLHIFEHFVNEIKPKTNVINFSENIGIWQILKEIQFQNQDTTLFLVFDQFEELFTYPNGIEDFAVNFSELLLNRMSKRYRDFLNVNQQNFSDEQLDFLETPLKVKILLSLRSDRLSLLDKLSKFVPNILRNCYELGALTLETAKSAIIAPASFDDKEFECPKFGFDNVAVEQIIKHLTQNGEKEIETFQLQTICQFCENLVIEKKTKYPQQIVNDDLGNLENVFHNFYNSIIERIDDKNRLSVRRFVENQLIQDERRISIDEVICLKNIEKTILFQLLDTHLLRSEPNTTGGFSYELCHDTMVAPILKAKAIRELEEQRIEEERAQKEELRIAKEKAEIERVENAKKRKRQQTIIAIVSVAACIAILLAIFGLWQMRKANKALTEVNKKQTEIEQKNIKLDSTLTIVEQEKAKSVELYKIAEEKKQEAVAEKETAVKATNLAQLLLGKSKLLLQSFLPKGLDENSVYTYFNTKGDSLFNLGIYDMAEQNYNLAKNAPNLPLNSNIETKFKNAQNCNLWTTEVYNLIWKQDYEKAEKLIQKILEINPNGKYSKLLASAINPSYATVYVEGGTFEMGCNDEFDSDCSSDEQPVHEVKLTSYEIGQYEVTNIQYAIFLNKYCCGSEGNVLEGEFTGKTMIEEYSWGVYFDENLQIWKPQAGYDYFPVVYVTWYGANEYCSFYGGSLPTEAQWEYAARGGKTNGILANAKELNLAEYAWYSENSKSATHLVGLLLPNELGLYDILGNVWEWNSDWYKSYEGSSSTFDYTNSGRVYRGGSWGSYALNCRVALRNDYGPNFNNFNLGFRVVFVF